jgi:hypothetical protein
MRIGASHFSYWTNAVNCTFLINDSEDATRASAIPTEISQSRV